MTGPASTKKILLIIVASVLGLAVVGGLGWGMFIGWTVSTQSGDSERGLTGEYLAAHYAEPDFAGGSLEVVRTRYLDGSSDVTVDYEVEDTIVTSSVYSIERKSSDALSVYGGLLVTGPLMETMADIELEDRDDLFDWGDNSSSKVIMVDGEPGGHVIVARKGKVAFMVTVGGLYEEDPALLEDLLRPVLDSAQRDG